MHGVEAGTFATRIPWFKANAGLSAGTLGLVLLAAPIGALVAMPLSGRLAHRIGGRAMTRLSVAGFCGLLAAMAFATGPVQLGFLLLAHGALTGSGDVVMNAQGVEVEEALGRPIMSGLHGMWSVGGLVGAGIGTVVAQTGVDARVYLAVVAVALTAFAVAVSGSLPIGRAAAAPRRFALPSRAVLGIGAVSFCAVFAEGAAANWCGVYLREVSHSGGGVAAAAYTAFALAMASGRLTGDRVVARLGVVRTVRAAGFAAVTGGLLVTLGRTSGPAVAGFALIGLGVAVIAPLAFAASGRTSTDPAVGVAGLGTIIYTCLLVAPAAIGGLAAATSLPVAFGLVTGVAAVMTARAGSLRLADATVTAHG
ncbi:MFS transporter [Actinocorallia longicatena]|uniref:MFS transporter n=1 Tax=Actinocorallia longicatena TaxID=111803 RepID=A0ABP6QB20_9ACTN